MSITMRLAVVAVAVAAISPGAGCHRGRSETAAKKEKDGEREAGGDRVTLNPEALAHLKLTYAKADHRELSPALEVTAELVPNPDGRAEVGARVAGRVVDVRVKIGDRVSRGAPLVYLESAEVGRARADRLAAAARLESARRTFDRKRALVQEGVTAKRELEEAERELRVAEAEVAAARTRLATFGAAPDEPAARNPAWIVLRSPISGTVVGRTVYVGRWAEPANPLIEIIDLDQLWLLASVYEKEMRYVERGQEVLVEVRARPGEVFTGRVEQVGDTVDEKTRTAAVRVSLPNPGHRLKPGMFATVRIQGTHQHEPRRMLVIPFTAVQEVDGHPAVFVRTKQAGAFELRKVHTAERAGDRVEVLNGLTAGDEVVVDGSFLLKGELLKSTLGEKE